MTQLRPDMFRFPFTFVALTCGCLALAAEPAAPPMTKIVARLVSPLVDSNSSAAKPKTLYRAGDKFARIEMAADTARGVQELVIISEPDMWIINLLDRTGRHEVDKGPTYIVHCPILPPGGPKEFETLEFGKEVAFFKEHKAKAGEPREIEGIQCWPLEHPYGDYRLVLYVAENLGSPRQLDIFRDGHLNATIRYESYEQNLTFSPGLFKPADDLKITEATAK